MVRRKMVLLAVAALVTTAACGGDDDGAADTDGTSAPETSAPGDTGASDATGSPEATSSPEDTSAPDATTAPDATGEPIVLGAVGSQTGLNIFPEPMAAATAVFDRVNEAGGVNGHLIEYLVEDDGNTPEQAATAAKRLVEDENVLAMVGGGSIVDCAANAQYYGEQGVYSLAGAAACPPEAASVASLNTGPFLGIMMTLTYMVEELGTDPLCMAARNVGLTPVFEEIFRPMWEQTTGYTLQPTILSEPDEDLTASVVKAQSDGCEGVLLAYTEPDYIAYAQIADAQGALDGIQYAMLTSGYSLNVLEQLGSAGEGWLANSEFAPYTDPAEDTPEMQDFKDLMEASDQELTSFGQSGYLAALVMVEALESIEGEYTRETVNAALEQVSYETPLLGEPFEWVPYVGGAQANVASKVVKIEDGEFVAASDWVFWPPR